MLILITGGSASGKSSFAETLCQALPKPHFYLATMRPYGKYEEERIARHLALRDGKGFITLEWYENFVTKAFPPKGGTVLLECLSNLTFNEMYDLEGGVCAPLPSVSEDISVLRECFDHVIVVTNEVGAGSSADYSNETKEYVKALGTLNCRIAAIADAVVEVVCAVPRVLKGNLPSVGEYGGTTRWDEA